MLSQLLVAAFARLDRQLLAVAEREERRAALLAGDGAAGWEGVRNLARPEVASLVGGAHSGGLAPRAPDLGFERVRRALGVPEVASDVLLMLLAPFVEPRYQTLYALLQDDASQPLATERLLLAALATGPEDRLALGRLLAPGAALRRSGVVVAPYGTFPPLRQPFTLSGEIAAALLGEPAPLLAGATAQEWSATPPGPAAPGERVPSLLLYGASGLDAAAAATLPPATRILRFRPDPGAAETVAAGWRLGLACEACPVADLRDLGDDEAREAARLAARLVAECGGRVRLLSRGPLDAEIAQRAVALPGFRRRRDGWIVAAHSAGLSLTEAEAGHLASRHRLGTREMAGLLAEVRGAGGGVAAIDTLAALHRRQVARRAVLRQPGIGLGDLVLREGTRAGLDRLAYYILHRDRVGEDQPGRAHFRTETGPVALFHGMPGTGKTMAAEALAAAVGRPFMVVDLSQLVSKYVGETEKHIDEVLREAETAGAVLFFDEADALFSRRVEKASSGGEQFSNMVMGYILQRIEQHDGPVVLATNLTQGLDEALMRRFRFRVEFPLPDADERARIWERMLGPDTEADLGAVARAYKLSGGEIRNAALKAVFLADERGRPIDTAGLEEAVRLELFELGRLARDGGAEDKGALLRGAVEALTDALEAHLRATFLKEVHVVSGPPTERTLSGKRPALSVAVYSLAGRRGGEGLRAGLVLSAWCARAEEELDILGVVQARLAQGGFTTDRMALKLQESHDFEMLQRFWSSHDQPLKPSIVLEAEIG